MPECYVERLGTLTHYYYELSDMRADLVSFREGLLISAAGGDCVADLSDEFLPVHMLARYLLRSCRFI